MKIESPPTLAGKSGGWLRGTPGELTDLVDEIILDPTRGFAYLATSDWQDPIKLLMYQFQLEQVSKSMFIYLSN